MEMPTKNAKEASASLARMLRVALDDARKPWIAMTFPSGKVLKAQGWNQVFQKLCSYMQFFTTDQLLDMVANKDNE